MAEVAPPITRCHSCLTLVYEGASTCHHCGTDLTGKDRRHFTRSTWAFIAFIVAVFVIGDAIYLMHEKKNRLIEDEGVIRGFVQCFLKEDWKSATTSWHPWSGELKPIQDLRASLGIGPVVTSGSGSPRLRNLTLLRKGQHAAPSGAFGAFSPVDTRIYRFGLTVREKSGAEQDLHGEACIEANGPFRSRVFSFHLQLPDFSSDEPVCNGEVGAATDQGR